MNDLQLWALLSFGAVMVLLAVMMRPRRQTLRGQQKYRSKPADEPGEPAHTSMSPFAALGGFLAGSAAHDREDAGGDAGHDSDSGSDGGGGE